MPTSRGASPSDAVLDPQRTFIAFKVRRCFIADAETTPADDRPAPIAGEFVTADA